MGDLSFRMKWLRIVIDVFGVGALIAFIFGFEAIRHQIQSPRLEVEILNWYGRRDAELSSGNALVFDLVEVDLNIIPHVRHLAWGFPANQVKSIALKKGEWYGPYKIVGNELPFLVKEDPVAIKLHTYSVPIEGPKGKPLEIRVVDRWGNFSEAKIENAF